MTRSCRCRCRRITAASSPKRGISERLCAETTAPEVPAEPITDAATIVLPPGHDVSDNLPTGASRLGENGVVAEDPVAPMSDEVILGLGDVVCAPTGIRFLLLVEEDVYVRLFDRAQADVDGRVPCDVSHGSLSLAKGGQSYGKMTARVGARRPGRTVIGS